MVDFVAHTDDVRPPNLGMPVGELAGHVARGFPDDLNEMDQCQPKVFVRDLRLARETLGLTDRLPCHVEHVPDVDMVTRQHTGVQRCSVPDRECGD
jgi:hypothetical protein